MLEYNFEQTPVGNPTSLFFLTNCSFSDADWASDESSHHSISGFAFFLYSPLISWSALSQCTVILSFTEVEYMALVHALKDGTWIRLFLIILSLLNTSLFPILCDNQSTLILQILRPSTSVWSISIYAITSSKISSLLVPLQHHKFLHLLWSQIFSWSLYHLFYTRNVVHLSDWSIYLNLSFILYYISFFSLSLNVFCCSDGVCWTLVLSLLSSLTYTSHVFVYIWVFWHSPSVISITSGHWRCMYRLSLTTYTHTHCTHRSVSHH